MTAMQSPPAGQPRGVEQFEFTAESTPEGLAQAMEPLLSAAERLAVRAVQEALTAAVPAYWLRRAAEYEDARPRPGDWPGTATEAELAERWQRLTATAEACRLHARFISENPGEVLELMREVVQGVTSGELVAA